MDTKQINDVLERYFHEEGARVVFWNDPDKEFQSILPSVQLSNVTVIRLDEHGALRTKIRIERDEPNNKFLLYSPNEEPDYENDWLLDVRLFSRSFRADRASILLEQLGLAQQHLRNHLADRRKFFDNKERLAKLKPTIDRNDVAVDLDRKMLGVLTKSEQPEFFNIVRALYHGYVDAEGSLSLDNAVAAWEQIEKFDLATAFWAMAETYFGYNEETPSLKALLIRLMVTDLAYGLRGNVPKALSNLVLPGVTRSNVITCLSQWRDSGSRCSSYDRLAGEVSSILHLADHLSLIEFSELAEAMTFLDVEKATVLGLRDRIQANASMIDAAEISAAARSVRVAA